MIRLTNPSCGTQLSSKEQYYLSSSSFYYCLLTSPNNQVVISPDWLRTIMIHNFNLLFFSW